MTLRAKVVNSGLGRRERQVSQQNLSRFLKVIRSSKNSSNETHAKFCKTLYANTFLYAPAITFAKLSVICLYRRALPVRNILHSTLILGVIISLWCMSILIADALTCTPIEKAWNPRRSGHCVNMHAYSYGLQVPNVVTGFALLVLPLPTVWTKCSLSRSEKLNVSCVVLVGVL